MILLPSTDIKAFAVQRWFGDVRRMSFGDVRPVVERAFGAHSINQLYSFVVNLLRPLAPLLVSAFIVLLVSLDKLPINGQRRYWHG